MSVSSWLHHLPLHLFLSSRAVTCSLLFFVAWPQWHVLTAARYSGKIEFSPESALPLLVVADKFELEHLHKLAVTYISQNIERENALQMLQQALRFHIKEIQDEATEVVSRNFSYIYDGIPRLPPLPLSLSLSPLFSSLIEQFFSHAHTCLSLRLSSHLLRLNPSLSLPPSTPC